VGKGRPLGKPTRSVLYGICRPSVQGGGGFSISSCPSFLEREARASGFSLSHPSFLNPPLTMFGSFLEANPVDFWPRGVFCRVPPLLGRAPYVCFYPPPLTGFQFLMGRFRGVFRCRGAPAFTYFANTVAHLWELLLCPYERVQVFILSALLAHSFWRESGSPPPPQTPGPFSFSFFHRFNLDIWFAQNNPVGIGFFFKSFYFRLFLAALCGVPFLVVGVGCPLPRPTFFPSEPILSVVR